MSRQKQGASNFGRGWALFLVEAKSSGGAGPSCREALGFRTVWGKTEPGTHPPREKGGSREPSEELRTPPTREKKKKEGVERHGEGGRASAEDLPLKGRGLSLSPPSYLRANC